MAHHDQYQSLVVLVVGLDVWVRECVYATAYACISYYTKKFKI